MSLACARGGSEFVCRVCSGTDQPVALLFVLFGGGGGGGGGGGDAPVGLERPSLVGR